MTNLRLVEWLLVLVYIWFETDAFIEWGRLLRLKFLKYEQYDRESSGPLGHMIPTYVDFLANVYDNFFVRLITCPVCLIVWLNIIGVCVFNLGIGRLPLNILVTWIGYFLMKRLM